MMGLRDKIIVCQEMVHTVLANRNYHRDKVKPEYLVKSKVEAMAKENKAMAMAGYKN